MRYDQPFCIIGSKGKFHPSYRFYLPALEPLNTKDIQPEPTIKPKVIQLRFDKGALNLNRRVAELENANRYLLKKIKELTAKASNRKTYDIK